MALFSFGDINITNKLKTGSNDSSLGISNEYKIMQFPIDIGNYDKSHYIVIHANQQIKSAFKGPTTKDLPTILENRRKYGYYTPSKAAGEVLSAALNSGVVNTISNVGSDLKKGLSKIISDDGALSPLKTVIEGAGNFINSVAKEATSDRFALGGPRTIERTQDTFVLYMPDTLNFDQPQSYVDFDTGGDLFAAGIAGGASLTDVIKNNPNASQNLINNLGNYALAAAGSKAPMLRAIAAGIQGMVTNPMHEIIYSSPEFRTFRFEFLMYPRSKAEALMVQNMLERFRFHQSPEIDSISKGYFMIPPSEFDIKFYTNGKENPNIPKISTCVLTNLSIDYAPNGFSAYEEFEKMNPELGGTGMPVGIRLMLEFKETELMLKNHYTDQKPKGQDAVSPDSTVNNENSALGSGAIISPNGNVGPDFRGGFYGEQSEPSGGGYVPDGSNLKYEAVRDVTFPKIYDNGDQYFTKQVSEE